MSWLTNDIFERDTTVNDFEILCQLVLTSMFQKDTTINDWDLLSKRKRNSHVVLIAILLGYLLLNSDLTEDRTKDASRVQWALLQTVSHLKCWWSAFHQRSSQVHCIKSVLMLPNTLEHSVAISLLVLYWLFCTTCRCTSRGTFILQYLTTHIYIIYLQISMFP